VAEAPGLGAGVDDVGAVGEAVDDGLGEAGVAEDLGPLAERQVGRDDQAAAFVALGEDLEDELGGAVGQGEVAEFVDLCRRRHSSDETWLLPAGVAVVVASGALLIRPLLAGRWNHFGGFVVLAGVALVLVLSVALSGRARRR